MRKEFNKIIENNMTNEEKQLLLQDLCARLPYRPKCHFKYGTAEDDIILKCIDGDIARFDYGYFGNFHIIIDPKYIKPYLRPMESMTEEERKELSDYLCEQVMSNKIGITIPPNPTQGEGIPFIWMGDCINWLNKKMFDYRELIPKGLALKALDGMYNIK